VQRQARFPHIDRLHRSGKIGKLLVGSGLILIFGNLVVACHGNNDPMAASKLGNSLYYALSRPSWVLGAMLILISIFTGHFGTAKAFLSTNNQRLIAKSIPCACILVILVIELLFCSNATPSGLMLTFPIALLFGLGFGLCTLVIAVLVTVFVEFPISRLGQIVFLPRLSHHDLLHEWHQHTVEQQALRDELGIKGAKPSSMNRSNGIDHHQRRVQTAPSLKSSRPPL